MPSKEDMAYKVAQDEAPAETPAAEGSHDEEGHEDDVQEEEEEDDAEEEPEEEEDEQPEPEEDPEEGEEGEGGERRPNRAERRIHQLTHKLKERTSPNNADPAREDSPRETGSELPWKQTEERPEQDYVELDPKKLDEMITRRAEEVIEAREKAAEQRQQAKGWLSDYEETVKKNPELDPTSENYNQELDDLLTEIVSNPDGTPKFGVKVSEALGKLRKTLTSAKKQGAKNASLKLAKQAEEGALAPGSSEGESHEYGEDEIRDLRVNSPREYQRLIKEGKI
jgi:chemotaxis protein histidine kinase CheA